MIPSEILDELKEISPWLGWSTIFVFVVLPALIAVLKKIVLFHNDTVRHYRAKNLRHALEQLEHGTSEYCLLRECTAQELVFLNTKLRLSKREREQVLAWMIERPITADLIRKAWGSVYVEKDGNLDVRVPAYDTAYMWYMIISAAALCVFGSYSMVILFSPSVVNNAPHFLLFPVLVYLMAVLMFTQCLPVLHGKRLEYRLKGKKDRGSLRGKLHQRLSRLTRTWSQLDKAA